MYLVVEEYLDQLVGEGKSDRFPFSVSPHYKENRFVVYYLMVHKGEILECCFGNVVWSLQNTQERQVRCSMC